MPKDGRRYHAVGSVGCASAIPPSAGQLATDDAGRDTKNRDDRGSASFTQPASEEEKLEMQWRVRESRGHERRGAMPLIRLSQQAIDELPPTSYLPLPYLTVLPKVPSTCVHTTYHRPTC